MKQSKYLTTLIAFIFIVTLYDCNAQIKSDTNRISRKFIKQKLGNENYSISLPSDFKIAKHNGEDFTVYWISPKDTSRKDIGSSGIYFGYWPSVIKPNSEACTSDSVMSEFLGQSRIWNITKCSSQLTIQTIVQIGGMFKIHAFANINEKQDLDLFLKIFESLKK